MKELNSIHSFWERKAGATKAERPAAIRATERTWIVLDMPWTLRMQQQHQHKNSVN